MTLGIARCCLAGVIFVVASMQPSLAQEYPEKAVRLIVPYAPGGTADLLARDPAGAKRANHE